ncbi:hypothetical protein [Nonomuraea polychroma]|uniref:hypothetical protein n=1 Tax=Nonomuraea polychroma TaxID=46176 RepID=UPI000FDDE906|nr:hypothetical protein [Nonomuraea polychroma]
MPRSTRVRTRIAHAVRVVEPDSSRVLEVITDQPGLQFYSGKYGAQDACALLVTEFQWTGSKDSIVAEMVNATNAASSAKADGLGVAVVDKAAFKEPVNASGIP